MAFPRFFAFWGDRTSEMAERIAGRSRMAVWQRVKNHLAGLGPIEARGYIRSRALPVVKDETARLIDQEGVRIAGLREPIVRAAAESLIRTILAQLDEQRLGRSLRQAA